MEHEDNAQLENYLQNSQNRIENLQLASSGGVIGSGEGAGDVAGEIVVAGNVGQKYGGEHDDDTEEWKYIKEGQQSEKHQQQQEQQVFGVNVGNDDDVDAYDVVNRADGNGISGLGLIDGHSNGGSNGSGNYEEEMLLAAHSVTHGNGNVHNIVESLVFGADGDGVVLIEEEDIEVIKNDGDFSTISNTDTTTASTGEVGAAVATVGDVPEADILQVDVKIEQKKTNEQQQQQLSHDDEEEPSSVATTYGTSSLSENPTPLEQEQETEQIEPLGNQPQLLPLQEQNPLLQPAVQQDIGLNFETFDNKENDDPADIENRPINLNTDLHSELNPHAMEFVPSFGSQPTSPTDEQPAFGTPRPAAVARHIFGNDDDLVAESPRKGLGSNMDAISLPAENEFEHEADQRPHGAEQDVDMFGTDSALTQHTPQELEAPQPLEKLENGNTNNEDCLDFQRQSPSSFVDHGPETSVDLDAEPLLNVNTSNDDVMNKSIYIEQPASNEPAAPIEDILNSVQVLPVESDSHNNSFIEQLVEQAEHVELVRNFETAAEGVKELLNVEEKEHVSHSPSTEELQMNLQNEMHSSIKDIPQLPIDPLDSAANMQESFYLEHTSNDLPNVADQSLLLETSIPQDIHADLLDDEPQEPTADPLIFNAPPHLLELTPEVAAVVDITPSPLTSSFTTEEKHLVEETKEQQQHQQLEDQEEEPIQQLKEEEQEQQQQQERENDLAQQMDALLSGDVIVGTPPQAKEGAESHAATNDNFNAANPFAVEKQEQSKYEFAQPSAAEQAFEGQVLFEAAEQKRHEIEKEHQQQQIYNDTLWSGQAQAQEHEQEHEQESVSSVHNVEEQSKPVEDTKLPELDAFVNEQETKIEGYLNATPEPHLEHNDVVKAAEDEQQPVEPLVTEEVLSPVETAPAVPEPVAHELPAEATVNEDAVSNADIAVAAATATAAVVAAAAATAVVAKTNAPEEPAKKPAAAKPKAAGACPATKKPATVELNAKKSTTSTKSAKPAGAVAGAAARPRTAPTAAAAKTTTTTTAATTAARKPLNAGGTTATKVAPKTSTATRPATAPAAAKPAGAAATRTTTTTTSRLLAARKPATATNGGAAAATAASKARTVPAKPTTLATNGTSSAAPAKPKLSPRSTLTSQLRKPATTATGTATGARSPTKPVTNGVSKTTTTTVASRAKLAGGIGTAATTKTTTTTTTVTTKTFTARPAPKTTHSSTLTATRRPLSAGTSTTTTTTTTTARKSSPLKPVNISGSKSPITAKSTTPLKAKAKEPIAKLSPSAALKGKKPGSATSPKVAAATATNGVANKDEQKVSQQQPQEQVEPLAVNGNGVALNETIDLDASLANDLPPLDAPKQPEQVALLDF